MEDGTKLREHLKKAMSTIELLSCSAEEAARITGLTPRYLLSLHRMNSPRVISYRIGREVIFDRQSMWRFNETKNTH